MKLNIEFKGKTNHAWLVSDAGPELFIRRNVEDLGEFNGQPCCWIKSDQVEEIREDDCLPDDMDPTSVFLCVVKDDEMLIYSIIDAIVFAGGDTLLLIEPAVTIH